MKGWIKLHRRILDNGILQDAELFRMFVWCILKANHTEKNFLDIKLSKGSFATGRISGSEELFMKPSSFYSKLKRLEKQDFIELQSTNTYTVVTIKNYSNYQIEETKEKIENIDKRKTAFKEQVKDYINEVPKNILTEFFNYWTETNKSGSKMKFELEKTWDIKRRLKTWIRNSSAWSGKPIGLQQHNQYQKRNKYTKGGGTNQIGKVL